MFFMMISVVMAGVAAMFAMHVGSEHVFAAILIPAAAGIGIAVLAST